MSWSEHTDRYVESLLEKLIKDALLAKRVGSKVSPAQIVAANRKELMRALTDSVPLAHIMDTSDLVLHAEGPSIHDSTFQMSAVTWITSTADTALRRLAGDIFNAADRDRKRISKELDLRLTGFAPGSLYTGVAMLQPAAHPLLEGNETLFDGIRQSIRALPVISKMIDGDTISDDICEILSDPAERDATLTALYSLSPTGKKGVQTLEISAPGTSKALLSQAHRGILKEAIERPRMAGIKDGAFVGDLREIDLDAHRIHLRGIPGVGSLRCIVSSLTKDQAKQFVGEQVRVEGRYESDRSGRPRLMLVERLIPVERPFQPQLA